MPGTIEGLDIPGAAEANVVGIDEQPISRLRWVHREELRANDYNPNHVHPPEMLLIILSLLFDGWTQPIVAWGDGVIVDGFHRWTCSGHPAVYRMTGGRVPVVFLPEDKDEAARMLSTIRHNRARGAHGVLPMSVIVRKLVDERGMTQEGVMNLLQMEREEVERLYDSGGMVKRGSADKLGKGWVPKRKKI